VQRAKYQLGVRVSHIPYPDPYRPMLAGVPGRSYGDVVADYLEHEIFHTLVSPEEIAGIMMEPIQGEGGYVIPAANFMPRLREICDRHGIMLIADEIQSGAGRTGRWWAIEHEDVEPDIVCFAKGIGSGMPIGGIIARKDLMVWGPGSHGSTFGGNPVAAASALATIDVIDREGLMAQAENSGEQIMDFVSELQTRHPSIGEVRGRGLMIGVEFVKNPETKERAIGLRDAIIQRAFAEGLLLIPCGRNAIRMTPALNVPQHLLTEGLQIFANVLEELEPAHI
jgi:4-aminobutyrate aminotransferase